MRLWYGQDGFEGQTTHTALPIPHAGESNYQYGPVRVIVASGRPVAPSQGNGNPIHVQPVPRRRRGVGRPSPYATAEERYEAKLARMRERYANAEGR